MALVECRECGKEVGTEAKTCPHCGTPKPAVQATVNKPTPDKPPVVETLRAGGWKKWAKYLAIAWVVTLVASWVLPKKDTATRTAAAPANPDCALRKADGRPGDRECDLVELCKDRRYQQRKVDSAQTMDDRVASMADLAQVQRWLAEYRSEDVQRVCSRN